MIHYHAAEYYLPHASPMVLLEQVLEVGEEHALCSVTVSVDGVLAPFLDAQGALPGWYGIELMAQAIGVWSGWHACQSAQSPQLGMLLGGRAIHCELPAFPAGSKLLVSVQQLLKDEKLASFECEISIDNVRIAQGRLNTYQPDQQEIIQLTTLRGDA
ncbi:(3R)-hydroxymyristoyl-ACP dehydratase [Serratia quinivorans]|uniref:(3R)-hydroxymyristoyl-ACP dehydratase n=1 Tax=Serratia quinivorans TaxID=137545 RepID=A0A379Z220_9GAMM|nr:MULTISPECIES: hotdog family protein [Serratia]MBV6693916.1 hotdog family protein [Serratia quinivorans]QBX66865.1 3-hydroxy-fatty acyl-ACP dehydratase [Serratia quinivorans]RYM57578.1 3-hydroxy-fatty acyl-ACP dehydratase [Serratia proteamaculans]CAI1208016.1 (3R)-hydroxymyristoyl-ACP dehydratase [Serratia quinivorans]CAI1608637.1 (3R)-hydroxymyristoyl-ACP dehydratase [Serratia quinivorans]